MSDTPESTEPVESTPKGPSTVAPTGILQKETDRAPRPGFRAPPNAKSKAQKAGKAKKKK